MYLLVFTGYASLDNAKTALISRSIVEVYLVLSVFDI